MKTVDDFFRATEAEQQAVLASRRGPDALRYYARELDDNAADPHPEMKRDA